jgi:hypothetical protein
MAAVLDNTFIAVKTQPVRRVAVGVRSDGSDRFVRA